MVSRILSKIKITLKKLSFWSWKSSFWPWDCRLKGTERSGTEKFRTERSWTVKFRTEKSGTEKFIFPLDCKVWDWKVQDWKVLDWKVQDWKVLDWKVQDCKVLDWRCGLKSPGLKCPSTFWSVSLVLWSTNCPVNFSFFWSTKFILVYQIFFWSTNEKLTWQLVYQRDWPNC